MLGSVVVMVPEPRPAACSFRARLAKKWSWTLVLFTIYKENGLFTIYVTSRVACCLLLLAAAAKTGFWGLQKSKFFNKFPGTQRATLATLPTPTMLGSVVVMVPEPRPAACAVRARLAKTHDF